MVERHVGSNGPTIIEPLDFRAGAQDRRRRRRRGEKRSLRRRLITLILLLGIAALLAGGGLALVGRQVELSFEPAPEQFSLSGPPLRFELGEGYWLWPGTYTVDATRTGYYPLQETFRVEFGKQQQRFHFDFLELPGVLALRCVGANTPEDPLAGVVVTVDGVGMGQTPLNELELPSGVHLVRCAAERYRDVEVEVEIEGLGKHQALTVELPPDWAEVQVATQPVAAELWVDGAEVATTPCTVELLAGAHQLQLRAEGYEPWEDGLQVIAEQPIDLTDVVLELIRGRLTITTEPSGAQVMVAGEYAGVAPVEFAVPPDEEVLVRVALAGHEPTQRAAQAGSDQDETVSFQLTAYLGTVRIEVDPPDATLQVDGDLVGAVPEELTLTALEHELQFSREGFIPLVRTITPRPGAPQLITVVLEPVQTEPPKPEADPEWVAADGYRLLRIVPGPFTMGASRREQGRRSNETLRAIRLDRPFFFGVREVTNEEFRSFRAAHQSGTAENMPLGGADRPVVNVSFDDAARYCNWLSEKDQLPPAYVEAGGAMVPVQPMSHGYRLPTEAEWEFVARVTDPGVLLKYPWGDQYPPMGKVGNFADESASNSINRIVEGYEDGYAGPAPVATFTPNARGVHDLGGNVAEWCHDFYSIPTYDAQRVDVDPMGPETGKHHVVRGSSWRDSSISVVRSSYRDYNAEQRDDLGFRLCRYLSDEEAADVSPQ